MDLSTSYITGDEFSADDMNQITTELINTITNSGQTPSAVVLDQIWNAVNALPEKYILDLIPRNAADTDHDITIGIGKCRSFDNLENMVLSSEITKQIDADWSVGNNAGGMPTIVAKTGVFTTVGTAVSGTGTAFTTEFKVNDILYSDDKVEGRVITDIADDTNMTIDQAFTTDVSVADDVKKNGLTLDATYHLFLLKNPTTGTIDAGFDTDVTALNLLSDSAVSAAGYTKYRRIGSFITNSSANLIPFLAYQGYKSGLEINYITSVLDYDQGTAGKSGTQEDIPITVPSGVPIKPIISSLLIDAGSVTISGSIEVLPNGTSVYTNREIDMGNSNCGVCTNTTFYTSTAIHRVGFSGGEAQVEFRVINKGYVDNRIS